MIEELMHMTSNPTTGMLVILGMVKDKMPCIEPPKENYLNRASCSFSFMANNLSNNGR